jgi:hypothetical protein
MAPITPNTPADAAAFGAGTATIMGLQQAQWRYAALRALMAVGCPEQLADGPRTVEELARACGAHAPSLARLLRCVAATGLFRTTAPGTFELTPPGRALLHGFARQSVAFNVDDVVYGSLGDLPEIARTGFAPFTQKYGSLYHYLSTKPEVSAEFDALMDLMKVQLAARVGELFTEPGYLPAESTVVDIGGAKGTFVAAILRANPGLRGILFDLERATAAGKAHLAAAGLADRCEVVAGDFFTAVPAGDAYILSQILHNWNDDQATTILRNIRAVIPGHGKLLVAEVPVPDDDQPSFVKDLDIMMLATHDGEERTLPEYEALFAAAGFRLADVAQFSPSEYLLTVVPVVS